MATFTIQDRRRGLQYADKVAEIASAAPDPFAKTQTYRMVRTLRKVYGFNDEEKRKYIRGLLKQGCSSYKDLVRESNMPRQEVERVVKTLTAEDPPQVSIALLISTGGREAAFISLIE